jgi:hypothetical protein
MEVQEHYRVKISVWFPVFENFDVNVVTGKFAVVAESGKIGCRQPEQMYGTRIDIQETEKTGRVRVT